MQFDQSTEQDSVRLTLTWYEKEFHVSKLTVELNKPFLVSTEQLVELNKSFVQNFLIKIETPYVSLI